MNSGSRSARVDQAGIKPGPREIGGEFDPDARDSGAQAGMRKMKHHSPLNLTKEKRDEEMNDEQVAEKGPNYSWRQDAKHYQDECEKLRALLRSGEHLSDRLAAENARLTRELNTQTHGAIALGVARTWDAEKIKLLETENAQLREAFIVDNDLIAEDEKELEALRAENAVLARALEKIADPRKRDHKEPDAYTQLGCVMNLASEALSQLGARTKAVMGVVQAVRDEYGGLHNEPECPLCNALQILDADQGDANG